MNIDRDALDSAFDLFTQTGSLEEASAAAGIPAPLLMRLFSRAGLTDGAERDESIETRPVELPAPEEHEAPVRPPPDARVAAMYAQYEAGATLEEVGDAFGITRQRVQQLFRAAGLSARSIAERRRRAAEARPATPPEQGADQRRRRPKKSTKRYSDEELIGCLREAARAAAGPLTGDAYKAYAAGRSFGDGRAWPTKQTPVGRFGSWRAALAAAGLDANAPSAVAGRRRFDRDACVAALREVGRALGRAPTAREYEEAAQRSDGRLPSVATVRNRCGGWSKALQAAGQTEPDLAKSKLPGQSPAWRRDELILALDLYVRRGNLNERDAEVRELSDLLRRLPIHETRPANFRTPASVNRKLGNFAALDPRHSGSGLPAGGKLDGEIYREFKSRPEDLAREAAGIRSRYASEVDPGLREGRAEQSADLAGWDTVDGLLRDLATTKREIRTVSGKINRVRAYAADHVVIETERGQAPVSIADIRVCWDRLVERRRVRLRDLLEPGHRSAFMAALFTQLPTVRAEGTPIEIVYYPDGGATATSPPSPAPDLAGRGAERDAEVDSGTFLGRVAKAALRGFRRP